MRMIAWLLVAAMTTPAPAHAGGTPVWLRAYMAEYSAKHLEQVHAMIPAWARRYNKNCNDCHWPAVPRLNAYGMRFKWAGYRPPDELGEPVNVAKVENYIAVRGRMRYQYNKTENQPASNSQFAFEDYTIFYGGPFGKNYGAFFELERAPGELELVANVASAWGKEKSFGGFRIGQFHWLQREGLAIRRLRLEAPGVGHQQRQHFVALDYGAAAFALGHGIQTAVDHAFGLHGEAAIGQDR